MDVGVYRLHDAAAQGKSFVGFSRNVQGSIKRLRFELALNACSCKPLQVFYDSCKMPEFELLESYSPRSGESATEISAHLSALLLKWRQQLGEDTEVLQQHTEP